MNSRLLAACLVTAVLNLPVAAQAQTSSGSLGDSAARIASRVGQAIERGAKATERGIKIGVEATARGIARGAQATARAAEAVARKLDTDAAPSRPAPPVPSTES